MFFCLGGEQGTRGNPREPGTRVDGTTPGRVDRGGVRLESGTRESFVHGTDFNMKVIAMLSINVFLSVLLLLCVSFNVLLLCKATATAGM